MKEDELRRAKIEEEERLHKERLAKDEAERKARLE